MRFSSLYLVAMAMVAVTNAAFTPGIATSKFQGSPKDMIYFEDSSNVLYHDSVSDQVFLSKDDGASWNEISLNLPTKILQIVHHQFDKTRAYILADDKQHYMTTDSGITWTSFSTPEDPAGNLLQSLTYNSQPSALLFNSQKSDYVIFAGNCMDEEASTSENCERQFYYSKDNMKSFSVLNAGHSCVFTNSAKNIPNIDSESVLCAVASPKGSKDTGINLVSSSDFFKSTKYTFIDGGIVTGAELLGFTDDFLMVVGTNFSRRQQKFIYVSYDSKTWTAYKLPESASTEGVKILDSSSSKTVNINVEGSSKSGQLYSSNGDNEFVLQLDSLRQDSNGNADYESIEGLTGVSIANSVFNRNQIKSVISFDNAHTWDSLSIEGCSADAFSQHECTLHLHSVVQRLSLSQADPGKYISSKVPGILIGVGNTGVTLESYETADTFISTNGGKSWSKTLSGPHMFEIGDSGSLIIAMEHKETNVVKYSMDFGNSWNQITLDSTLTPSLITTTVDSTSMKFLIAGTSADEQAYTIALDFSGVYSVQCSDSDFESWSLGACSMGVKQVYKRRLSNANCFVGNLYNEALVEETTCECVAEDYICAPGYEMVQGSCSILPELESEIVDSQCTQGQKTYTIPNGLVLKSGNNCDDSNSEFLSSSNDVTKPCPVNDLHLISQREEEDGSANDNDDDSFNPDEPEGAPEDSKGGNNDGKVRTSVYTFKGKVANYVYLEKPMNSDSDDETLLALTSENEVFVTHDQGSSWEEVAPEEEFLGIYLNHYKNDHVYLLATNDKVVYSRDRGDNWKSFRTPARAIPGNRPLYFHPTRPNYMIFVGQEGCDQAFSKACRTVAYVTRSYGKRWLKIQENINHCQFIGGLQKKNNPELMVCHKQSNQATNFQPSLIASRDNFKNEKITLLENVIGFVQVADYLVAATALAHDELRAHVSVDALNWADAYFPANFHVEKQQAYTTLSGSTKSIFLHITTNPHARTEFGTIMKSNSNGTSYVVSLDNVNRDSNGYVDFEQMSGMEGVIVVNTVENPSQARKGNRKKLKSRITHNDGAQWDYIQPPALDSEKNKYPCIGQSLDKCSLNLHGYTERADYRDTFSSESAVGMMLAVGNVGENLENYYDGHTFLTKDGGITWKEIKKGVYMWEYGDQGSVIVIVNGKDNTNTISYTTDEGDTWTDYKFTDDKVTVEDISTVPSDNSLKFLLFTRVPLNRGDKTRVFQLDFTQLLSEPCSLDLVHPDIDDFELWTPKHPFQSDNCLFGHETQYYRKIPGKLCHIGKKLTQPHKVVRDCACTRQDYECDFNYQRDFDGICRLVPGYNPPNHEEVCFTENPPTEYWKPTGYRKIPLSTCVGGQEFDKVEPLPCPGKEDQFYVEHPRMSFFLTAVVTLLVLGVVAFFGMFCYNFFVAKYGEIRLGEDANMDVVDGSFKTQLSQFAGATFITTVAMISQGVKGVITNVQKARDYLKSRITGRGSRYSPVSAYIVTEDDEANEFLGANNNESSYSDETVNPGSLDNAAAPSVDTGENDLNFSDDEADLGTF